MADEKKAWYVLRAISGKEAKVKEVLDAQIRNTTNVIDFLRGRGKNAMPEALRTSEVQRMLGMADELADVTDDGINDYLVGETVKVTDGPFGGFTGEIEEVDREKKKLKVMVKIFGRKTPLELENQQVERV